MTTTTPIKAENVNTPSTENQKSEKTNATPSDAKKENENQKKNVPQTEEATKSHQVGEQEVPKSPRAEGNSTISNEA